MKDIYEKLRRTSFDEDAFKHVDSLDVIREIKKHEIIYNPRHDKFHDTTRRDSVWEQIVIGLYPRYLQYRSATKIQIGIHVRRRWTSLRSCIAREVKYMTTRDYSRKKGSLLTELEYFIPYIGSPYCKKVEVDAKCAKLIIRERLDMEEEFVSGRKKKSVLWNKVLEKIKVQKPDFNLTKEQVTRKFINLQTTYKRIKKRNKDTGRNATTWEFFEDFDEIYSTRHSIDPPVANLISSLPQTHESANGEDSMDLCVSSQEPNEGEPQNKREKRGNQNEVLQYLQNESAKDQKRHEELMAMEERKLLMEQERINTMSQLKDVLERLCEKLRLPYYASDDINTHDSNTNDSNTIESNGNDDSDAASYEQVNETDQFIIHEFKEEEPFDCDEDNGPDDRYGHGSPLPMNTSVSEETVTQKTTAQEVHPVILVCNKNLLKKPPALTPKPSMQPDRHHSIRSDSEELVKKRPRIDNADDDSTSSDMQKQLLELLIDIEHREMQRDRQTDNDPNDMDRMFFLSLAPDFKTISARKKISVKAKITAIIDQAMK